MINSQDSDWGVHSLPCICIWWPANAFPLSMPFKIWSACKGALPYFSSHRAYLIWAKVAFFLGSSDLIRLAIVHCEIILILLFSSLQYQVRSNWHKQGSWLKHSSSGNVWIRTLFAQGPQIVSVPQFDTPRRYWIIQFSDAYQNFFAAVGATYNSTGRYLLVGRGKPLSASYLQPETQIQKVSLLYS